MGSAHVLVREAQVGGGCTGDVETSILASHYPMMEKHNLDQPTPHAPHIAKKLNVNGQMSCATIIHGDFSGRTRHVKRTGAE
jgi:hypothetical protein